MQADFEVEVEIRERVRSKEGVDNNLQLPHQHVTIFRKRDKIESDARERVYVTLFCHILNIAPLCAI